MTQIISKITVSTVLAFIASLAVFIPFFASAQTILDGGNGGALGGALQDIVEFIQGVLIPFLFAIGFFMFVWGMIKFFVIGGNNDDDKAEGKSLIIYALAGFVIILIFWGLVNIIASGIGLEDEELLTTPSLPGGR